MSVSEKMTAIADAIRGKTGGTEPLTLDQMAAEIAGIETGGLNEQEIIKDMAERTFPSGDLVFEEGITVKANAFYGCHNITSVKSNGSELGDGAFRNCKGLLYAEHNGPASAGYHFADCINLKTAKWNSNSTSSGMFWKCSALEFLDCGPDFYYIGVYFVVDCKNLKTLVLRNTKRVVQYANAGAFNNSPFATNGTGGTVYVPAALIEQYQQATNWSALYAAGTCVFKALEDYTVDGTTTGEIDWAKIEA